MFNQPVSPSAKALENLSPFIGRVHQQLADNIVATCGLIRLGFGDSRHDNRGQAQAKKTEETSSTKVENSCADS
jgi:hypothetical protein